MVDVKKRIKNMELSQILICFLESRLPVKYKFERGCQSEKHELLGVEKIILFTKSVMLIFMNWLCGITVFGIGQIKTC